MSDPWIWVAILAAAIGGYLSTLHLSLGEFLRSELEERLAPGRQVRWGAWLVEHLDGLVTATALWNRIANLIMLFAAFMSLRGTMLFIDGEDSSGVLALSSTAVALLLWIWLFEIGLARAIAEHVATPIVAWALGGLIILHVVTLPLTLPLATLSEIVRRLTGAERADDLEQELRQVVEEGEREGNIGETEREMIEAVVDFRNSTVDEVMTPRIDIKGIELTDDLARIKPFLIEEGHSRFPVYVDDLDHIEGVLYVKDLLPLLGRSADDFNLKSILREAILVPESRPIRDLLRDFQQRKVHMAFVLDEYGGTAGLVTIEDIVEEIFGEIRDEHEPDEQPEATIHHNDDGTVDIDARVHIDDLNDELGLDLPEDGDYDTVGGWIFATLGRIPKSGETISVNGLEVEVVEAQRTHIIRLRIRIRQGKNAEHSD